MGRPSKTRSKKNRLPVLRKAHVKKGDTVIVIAGVEKGSTGKVLAVDRARWRVLIEGVNRRQQTIRPSQLHPQGGMIEKECPVHISNVMLLEEYEQRKKRHTAAPRPAAAEESEAKPQEQAPAETAPAQEGQSSSEVEAGEANKDDD